MSDSSKEIIIGPKKRIEQRGKVYPKSKNKKIRIKICF